jgi:hypothetical protein
MPRYRYIQNSFLNGEVSQEATGRTDLDLYGRAVQNLINMSVKSTGGAARRPGTRFQYKEMPKFSLNGAGTALGTLPFGTRTRIIPFIFSRTDAFAIFLEKDRISIKGVSSVNDGHIISYVNHSALLAVTNTFTGYATDDEVDEVQFAQTGDIIILVHPKYMPIIIARVSTSLTTDFFVRYAFYDTRPITARAELGELYPYFTVNTNTLNTMTIAAGGGTLTSSVIGTFDDDHVGTFFKVTAGGVTYYFFVQAFTSTTVVTGTSLAVGGAGPTTDWEEGAWSDFRGWPRTVTFFEQRAFYAGTNKKPDTTWGSQIGDIFQMDGRGVAPFPAPNASSPFAFTVAADEVNQIQWLSPSKTLVIGTAGQEFIAQGTQGALSAVDISVTTDSNYGSSFVRPVRNENSINFVSRDGRTIREYVFNRDQDSFIADDLTRFAGHLMFKNSNSLGVSIPKFKALVRQDSGTINLWGIDNIGRIYNLSRDRATGVLAWARNRIGGSLIGGGVPFTNSICVLPSNRDGSSDELWLSITRTINAVTVTYMESIAQEYKQESLTFSIPLGDACVYVDSARVSRFLIPTNTITGLSHLEGATVQVLADNFYLGEFVVSGAQIVLPVEYSLFVVGFKYTSQLSTLTMEAGSGIGTAISAMNRVDKATIRFYNSLGAVISTVGDSPAFVDDYSTEISFRDPPVPMDTPLDLFTGNKIVELTSNYERGNVVSITSNFPFPMHITAIILRGVVND